MSEVLVTREQKVMFQGVPETGGTVTYKRMQGFTDMSKSHNAQEYSRRYVDEKSERTDLTGYAPSISFAFDQMLGNAVHDDIVKIVDGEKIGTDCVRSLILVDLTTKDDVGKCTGLKRNFSIIPSSEGDSTDAYTYSGEFKANGETEVVTGEVSADGLTFTIDTTTP